MKYYVKYNEIKIYFALFMLPFHCIFSHEFIQVC